MLIKFNSVKRAVWVNPDLVLNIEEFTGYGKEGEAPVVLARFSADLTLIITGATLDEVAQRLNERGSKQ